MLFKDYLNKLFKGKTIPLFCDFLITDVCNLNCKFCYCNKKKDQISTEKVKIVLDKIKELNVLYLIFNGGEPFLRKDFLEIHKYAKKLGFVVGILTNSTLIDKKSAEILRRYPAEIYTTIYGSNNKIYEKVTGDSKGFEKFDRGINNLLSNNIQISLKLSITKLNYNDYKNMIAYAKKKNVSWQVNAPLHGTFKNKNIDSMRLSTEEYKKIADISKNDIKNQELFKKKVKNELFWCRGGRNAFSVSPQGIMNICAMARTKPFPSFDLTNKKISINYAWKKINKFVNEAEWKTKSKCKTCALYGNGCAQCPANAYLENKNMELPNKHYCKLTYGLNCSN